MQAKSNLVTYFSKELGLGAIKGSQIKSLINLYAVITKLPNTVSERQGY